MCSSAANPQADPLLDHRLRRCGPYSARPAYDNVAVALSGIASLQLDPEHPQSSGPTIADNATGMFACYGILGALYERERSGRGHRVEVNMLESGIAFIPDPFANYTRAGIKSDRLTRVAASQSFAFRCGDGKLLAVHLSSQPKFFEGHRRRARATRAAARRAVCDARSADHQLRRALPILAEIVATRPRAHWMDRARGERRAVRAGAEPAGRARRSAGAPSRNVLQATPSDRRRDHRHPLAGSDRRRGATQRTLPAPTLGEHTDAVLAELGYDAGEIGKLRETVTVRGRISGSVIRLRERQVGLRLTIHATRAA